MEIKESDYWQLLIGVQSLTISNYEINSIVKILKNRINFNYSTSVLNKNITNIKRGTHEHYTMIEKLHGDWFLVYYYKRAPKSIKFYQCYQLFGLIECLEKIPV